MKSIARIAALLLLLSASLFAQSQQEMNFQAERDAAKADKALNVVYKKLLASVDEEGAKLLKDSQRAWIAFRDAEAKFAADEARGGSMATMLYSGTLARLTEERVKQLKEHLGDGDPAPPVEEKPQKDKPEGKSRASATGAKPLRDQAQATLDRAETESAEQQQRLQQRLEDNRLSKDDGASTRHKAALAFFEAYKAHNRKAALAVATGKAVGKLVWEKDAGDNPTLKLMDDTHIYYVGGSIEMKLQKTKDDRWIISDVGMTAD